MKEYGSSLWERLGVYGAVRIGGGGAWDQNREDRINGLTRIIPPTGTISKDRILMQTCAPERKDDAQQVINAEERYRPGGVRIRRSSAEHTPPNMSCFEEVITETVPIIDLPENIRWKDYRQELFRNGVRANQAQKRQLAPAYCSFPEASLLFQASMYVRYLALRLYDSMR
jgi:hypothetical protein